MVRDYHRVFVARSKRSEIEEVIVNSHNYFADGGLVGKGMAHSYRNGVSGNMSRRLCWWAELGGEKGDSLLIGGKMVHPLGKSSREVGFLLMGIMEAVRCCLGGLRYCFIVRIGFGNALKLRVNTSAKRKHMKAMIGGSLYDTCLSFVSTDAW